MILSPGWVTQSVPAPPVSWQDQGVSLPKDLLSSFNLTSQVGPCGPSRFPQLLFPIVPDLDPSFCRETTPPTQALYGRQKDTLALFWQLLPAANSWGWGQARLWGESLEKKEGVSLWSAPSSDLGPRSLLLMLPTTQISSSPHLPPLQVAPEALLWIRVTRGGVIMQIYRLQPWTFWPRGSHKWGMGI